MLTPSRCRAARVGIDLSRKELARVSGVGERTIIDFERGARKPIPATQRAIRLGLEREGVKFTEEGWICLPEEAE